MEALNFRPAGQSAFTLSSTWRHSPAARHGGQYRSDPDLFWTAVINWIVAVVGQAKGALSVDLLRRLKLLGWLASALMALAVGDFVWSSLS